MTAFQEAFNAAKKRKEQNEDIVKRMREGDGLSNFSSQGSHFPPRAIIKKDPKEVEKIFGDNK